MPFKYKNSLMNSSLSNKDTAFMNRIALKERKIEENEIVGAERLYKIKTFFKNIKNKVNKRIETVQLYSKIADFYGTELLHRKKFLAEKEPPYPLK